MTDTKPENVPAPPPFVQPELVKCTTEKCEKLVSVFARACPSCGNPDLARYHKSRDPLERTLARWQYDHSPAVVAWNNAQAKIKEEQQAQRLQAAEKDRIQKLQTEEKERIQRDEYQKTYSWLERQYKIGTIFNGVGLYGAFITTFSIIPSYLIQNPTPTIFCLIPTLVSFRLGYKIQRNACDKGYEPPYMGTGGP